MEEYLLRSIILLGKPLAVAYINELYIRDFYLNEPMIVDFTGLENLKDINIFTWGLNVDLRFNRKISDDELNFIVQYLENHENVKSTGYKGKDFIRVQLNHKFYDKVVNKTLVITDFIDGDILIDDYKLTISIINFTPMAYIRFHLEVQGKEQAAKMIDDLINGMIWSNKQSYIFEYANSTRLFVHLNL